MLDLPARGFDGFLSWVLELRRELGIPHSLAEIGVSADKAAIIGREAAIDPSAGGNPIPVDAAQLEHIFRAAVDGQARGRGQRRVTGARILVIDGNVAEIRARQIAALGYDSGTGYAQVLRRIDPSLQIDIVLAADADPKFPPGVGLENYDGVTMTGSALNIYNGGAPVTRQIELAKAVFAAGVPFFGSCWGLQVAVTAAGGEVRANPRGREFGFARRILLSDAGREHRLFAGKPVDVRGPHRSSRRDRLAAGRGNNTGGQ